MRHAAKTFIMWTVIALAAVAALPGVSDAKKLTDYNVIMNMEFGFEQGVVTAKSPQGDYLSVSGRNVFVVEYKVGLKNIATSFYDLKGNPITFDDVKVGDNVCVYGGALKDDTRAAKDIFITSGRLTGAKRKAFVKEKKLKPWAEEPRAK
jgi:hypothetical protein